MRACMCVREGRLEVVDIYMYRHVLTLQRIFLAFSGPKNPNMMLMFLKFISSRAESGESMKLVVSASSMSPNIWRMSLKREVKSSPTCRDNITHHDYETWSVIYVVHTCVDVYRRVLNTHTIYIIYHVSCCTQVHTTYYIASFQSLLSYLVCVCVCWPLPSNQSFYRQIAGYQRGVGNHRVD